MSYQLRFLALAALLISSVSLAHAEVKPNGLFTDNMVLQREKKVPVWGTAADDEAVTVSIGDQKVETKAKEGRWSVELAPLKAGGPHLLTISGSNKIELKNVLVGEVWLAGGQSNMEWSVNSSENPKEVAAASANDQIRLFTVPRNAQDKPTYEVKGNWNVCGPETVGKFSAVAYHFGAALQKKLGVPVGLISSNWGGTPAQRWTAKEVLESNPELAGYAKGKSDLYNGMIHPLLPFALRGAIWYQGESNAGQAHRYRTLFPAMIKNWRDDFKQGDFPFLLVQLAPYQAISPEPQESSWAELREAQLLATRLPNVGMAVITDIGNEKDIHPKPKQPVGERLALAARAIAYGEKIEHTGPLFDSLTVKGNEAHVKFKNVGEGLVAKGDKLTGFTIAGEDHKFYNAEAKIVGDTVVVTSDKVGKPVAVRFGWANFPVVNLWNKDGLPASPFRTDDFQTTTYNK